MANSSNNLHLLPRGSGTSDELPASMRIGSDLRGVLPAGWGHPTPPGRTGTSQPWQEDGKIGNPFDELPSWPQSCNYKGRMDLKNQSSPFLSEWIKWALAREKELPQILWVYPRGKAWTKAWFSGSFSSDFPTRPPSASAFILISLLGHQYHCANEAISTRIRVSCHVGAGSSFSGTSRPHS